MSQFDANINVIKTNVEQLKTQNVPSTNETLQQLEITLNEIINKKIETSKELDQKLADLNENQRQSLETIYNSILMEDEKAKSDTRQLVFA